MKQVSLQQLKVHLSRLVELAAGGETVLITRYRKPVARLEAAGLEGLRVGRRHGRGDLSPLFRRATKGRYLDLLHEDRSGEPGDG